jgi:hypothetical protein
MSERGKIDNPHCQVRAGECAGIEYETAPCPRCGATSEKMAETKCRPTSDQTGEYECPGEFDKDGVSVQPTAASLAAMDAWIDEQVAADEATHR